MSALQCAEEARHVAFGMAHLEHRLAAEPGYRVSLRHAVEQRYDELAAMTGLSEEVFDALVLLAGGGAGWRLRPWREGSRRCMG